ncbi:hypothetical protein T484DRAFT_1984108 [Baffinella frigidus]|nr:hypothetical protein T484DRAFT_1984108 [Cryptophyta sp. CCMP2293]
MSSRPRSRSSRDAPPDYFDARSQASADSDERHSMQRRKDVEYAARVKADFNFYWGVIVKIVMSIFFIFSTLAGIVKMTPGILIGFLNLVGGFGEVCAAGVAFCACANQNHTCECDCSNRHGM